MSARTALPPETSALVARRLGLDFSDRRQGDLERGLARALECSRFEDTRALVAWLAAAPDDDPELRRLVAQLTVGETYFFRDRACFDALRRHVLPALVEMRRAEGRLRLRLWSAGCATGEEPYSLAMLLDELLPDRARWSLTLLATDVNGAALETARRARYREWSLRETSAELRARYFRDAGNGTFELDDAIRRMAVFAPLNLAADVYPDVLTNTTAMDVILCRNVLMYFTPSAQRAAIERLRGALATGGWLVPSPVDAPFDAFVPLASVSFTGTVLYKREASLDVPPAPWAAAPPPAGAAPMAVSAPADSAPPALDSPGPAHDSVDLARVLAGRGQLDDAERLCRAAGQADRLDAEPQLLLAAIQQERGDLPAALEALRRALYLAPEAALGHFLQGALLLRQAQRTRGRRCLENVVRLLADAPQDEPVLGGGGVTAGRLLATARAYLEMTA